MIDLGIPGQMTEGELRELERLARRIPAGGIVVEAGSLYGRSSYTWATTVDPSVTVYCIDPWQRDPWIVDLVEKHTPDCPPFGLDAFRQFTIPCKNIVPLKGLSPQDFSDWDKPVDVFFDDSLHHNPYLRRNLRFWLEHVRPGGIICGHDYCGQWPDVVKEAEAIARELDSKVHVRQWVWWVEVPNVPRNRLRRWARRWR